MATQTYGPDALFQARSADPRYEYYEADQVAPAGQWRTRVNGDAWTLERAATAEFATVTTPISVASTGAITYSGTGTYTWTNTTDAASVQVAIFQGDRATPGDNDAAYISLRLSDSAGNQDEQARITWIATTVLSGATQDGDLVLSALVNNTLTELLRLDGSIPAVVVNEGAADVNVRIEAAGNINLANFDAGLFGNVGGIALGGAIQATPTAYILIDPAALTVTANQNFSRVYLRNGAAMTVAGATTSAVVASMSIDEVNVTATGTVTSTALLYLTGLATEGTSNAQIVLQGSASSTTLVQADRVQLLALDFATGDARLAVYSETGGVAYLGGGQVVVGSGDATIDMGLFLDSSGTDWYVAIDNSDSDALKIGTASAVGTNTALTFSSELSAAFTPATTTVTNGVTVGGTVNLSGSANSVAVSGFTLTTALTPNNNGVSPGRTIYGAWIQFGTMTGISGSANNRFVDLVVTPAGSSLPGGATLAERFGLWIDDIGATGTVRAQIALTTGAPTLTAVANIVQVQAYDFAGGDARLAVQSELGSPIYIGNNRVALGLAGTGTGAVTMSGATSGTVTLTVAATAGTWTFTLPPDDGDAGEQLQTNGGGITTWEAAASRRALKDVLGELQPRDALDRILGTQAYLFRYTTAQHTTGDLKTIYAGVMAEEAPWVMHHDGRIFSPVSAFGYASMAIRALHEDIETVEQRVGRLESENASLRERIAVLEG